MAAPVLLLEVAQKVKRLGVPAKVGVVAAREVWSADPLQIDFYVVPAEKAVAARAEKEDIRRALEAQLHVPMTVPDTGEVAEFFEGRICGDLRWEVAGPIAVKLGEVFGVGVQAAYL